MPNFEKVPPFEKDNFEYEKKEEEIAEVEEAIEEQKEELKTESKSRFRNILGKAALALTSIFGGAGEAESSEAPRPVKEYKMPPGKEELPLKPGPEYRVPAFDYGIPKREMPRQNPEIFVTSKSLADMLGVRQTEDLGGGRYSVVLRGKKYEIGQDCLAEMANIKAKYAMIHGRTKAIARAEAMTSMRNDLKEAVVRMGKEVADMRPARKTASSVRAEKEALERGETAAPEKEAVKPARKTTKNKEYYKNKSAYDKYE